MPSLRTQQMYSPQEKGVPEHGGCLAQLFSCVPCCRTAGWDLLRTVTRLNQLHHWRPGPSVAPITSGAVLLPSSACLACICLELGGSPHTPWSSANELWCTPQVCSSHTLPTHPSTPGKSIRVLVPSVAYVSPQSGRLHRCGTPWDLTERSSRGPMFCCRRVARPEPPLCRTLPWCKRGHSLPGAPAWHEPKWLWLSAVAHGLPGCHCHPAQAGVPGIWIPPLTPKHPHEQKTVAEGPVPTLPLSHTASSAQPPPDTPLCTGDGCTLGWPASHTVCTGVTYPLSEPTVQ